MSQIVKLRTRAQIDEEAAAWTWRMDCESVTTGEQQAFDAWLRQDLRHRRAYDELARVWRTLDGLAEAKRDEKIATFTDAGMAQQKKSRLRWAWAAAAILAVVVGGLVSMQRGREVQTLSTAVGQQRNVTLADGSIVTLNTNTIVETDLSRHLRQIYLRKGEAHFQVAHDRSRPFYVHAGDAVVRAVGTQFEVRLRTDQHVDITVNEGRVEVQATGSEPAGSGPNVVAAPKTRVTAVRALSAGEALSTAAADYSVRPVTAEQLSNAMAWREGEIIFDGKSLGEAVNEIERYTDARIIITDSKVAALRVGGRFRTDNAQAFFDALQSALPVSITRAADGAIYLGHR
jgi:transmembrane sensor